MLFDDPAESPDFFPGCITGKRGGDSPETGTDQFFLPFRRIAAAYCSSKTHLIILSAGNVPVPGSLPVLYTGIPDILKYTISYLCRKEQYVLLFCFRQSRCAKSEDKVL